MSKRKPKTITFQADGRTRAALKRLLAAIGPEHIGNRSFVIRRALIEAAALIDTKVKRS